MMAVVVDGGLLLAAQHQPRRSPKGKNVGTIEA